MSKAKIQAGEAQCPNCNGTINVPKSTRSLICRHCDAIIKIVDVDDGLELKVVGRSVAEDPTYQELEAQVTALKEHIAELHKQYEVEAARPLSNGMLRLGLLGVLALVVGLVWLVAAPALGGAIALAGLVLTVAGFAGHSARKRARFDTLAPISKQIEQVGAQRDLLQLKAARLKTQV